MCLRCWTRSPTRPVTQAENLMAALDTPPPWLVRFAEFATERHCVARACLMVSAVGRLATDGQPAHPQAMLERSRRPGRSAGALARTLEEFLVGEHLAFGLDQDARLAHGRRQRRVDAVPSSPSAGGRRVRRSSGPLPRASSTGRNPSPCGQHHRADPEHRPRPRPLRGRPSGPSTTGPPSMSAISKCSCGTIHQPAPPAASSPAVLRLGPQEQGGSRRSHPGPARPASAAASPARRSASPSSAACSAAGAPTPAVHPHEALVGILALLHAASSLELRQLRVADFDPVRSQPAYRAPTLDPTRPGQRLQRIQRCLEHRELAGHPQPAPHRDHPNQDPQHSRLDRLPVPRARRRRAWHPNVSAPRASSIWS